MTELDFETKLKKILKKVFEIDEINLNYSMDDIPEWDSFKHILLLTKIDLMREPQLSENIQQIQNRFNMPSLSSNRVPQIIIILAKYLTFPT